MIALIDYLITPTYISYVSKSTSCFPISISLLENELRFVAVYIGL